MLKNYIWYSYFLLATLTLPFSANAQRPINCGPQYGYPCSAQANPQLPPNPSYRPGINPQAPRFVNTIDLSVSRDAGLLDYRHENPLYDINAGYLRNDNSNNDVYYFGILAGGYYQQVLPAPTRMGIGVIGVGVDTDEGDGGAVAVAGTIRFPLHIGFPGLALEGKISYAPSIISFGDVDEYFEIDAKIVYNALPNASIFAGLRNVEADIEKIDGTTESIKVDDGFYGGVRLRF